MELILDAADDCVLISIGWYEVGGGRGRRVGKTRCALALTDIGCYCCLVHLKLLTHFIRSRFLILVILGRKCDDLVISIPSYKRCQLTFCQELSA